MELYVQQGEKNQHGRHTAQIVPLSALLSGAAEHPSEAEKHASGEPHGDVGESRTRPIEMAGHYPAGEGVHQEPHPALTRPGKHTEPKARPEGCTEAAGARDHRVRVRAQGALG